MAVPKCFQARVSPLLRPQIADWPSPAYPVFAELFCLICFFRQRGLGKFCNTPFIASAFSFCWLFCASLFGRFTGLGAGFGFFGGVGRDTGVATFTSFLLLCSALAYWPAAQAQAYLAGFLLFRKPALVVQVWVAGLWGLPAAQVAAAGAVAVAAFSGSPPVLAQGWISHYCWLPDWFLAELPLHPR